MLVFMHFTDIVLAIVQGATEFLPVSSSGHLVLLHSFFGLDAGLSFDIVLHVGTLLAVLWFYKSALWNLISGFFTGIHKKIKDSNTPLDARVKIVLYLILATMITAIIGFSIQDWVETQFRSILFVGILLIVNSAILYTSRLEGLLKLGSSGLNAKTAILIGLAQGLAVLPGISRSGATISMALILGIKREDCAEYSFILSIPVILGALILHVGDISAMQGGQIAWLSFCGIIAAGVGLFCLRFLVSLLRNMRFHYFAPYCLALGSFAVFYALVLQ
ncbi:MAG: undecaprenyl-diphosphate phosphatase [Bradymonadales bacterium]|jgi:undecaprenyl-diphosphatase